MNKINFNCQRKCEWILKFTLSVFHSFVKDIRDHYTRCTFQIHLNSDSISVSDSVPSKSGFPKPIPFQAQKSFRFRFPVRFRHRKNVTSDSNSVSDWKPVPGRSLAVTLFDALFISQFSRYKFEILRQCGSWF